MNPKKLLILFILLILAGSNACVSSPPPLASGAVSSDYVSVTSFAQRNGLEKVDKDFKANKIILAGTNKTVILALGMKTAVVNSQPVQLDDLTYYFNSDFQITSRAAGAIEIALKKFQIIAKPPKNDTKNCFKKIVIDAGHGGKFPGAEGPSGLLEKTVTLDVAQKLKKFLQNKGITVVMTRDADVDLAEDRRDDLKERVRINNTSRPDLFVSIHANAEQGGTAEGFEVYYAREDDEDRPEMINKILRNFFSDDVLGIAGSSLPESVKSTLADIMLDEFRTESREIAEIVRKEFKKSLSEKDRGVKEADFYVIKWAQTPAILIETEFITHPEGECNLNDPAYRQKLAETIGRAILYFKARFDSTERLTTPAPLNN